MSPRSIWTACLMALTVFTPMGACAGLPDGFADESIGPDPDGLRPEGRLRRSVHDGRQSSQSRTPRRVVPALGLFATGSAIPVPPTEPKSDPAANLIWLVPVLVVVAFAVLLIRIPGSRRPMAALAMFAVAVVGAIFIAFLGILSSWTDSGTNVPPLFLGAAIAWAVVFLAGAIRILPRSRAPR